MLDDLKFIHEKDANDTLGTAEKQWQQLKIQYNLNLDKKQFSNIVLSGMGGSALAALVAQIWPDFDIPFYISRGYEVPMFLKTGSLFIASSYSGNTEESLSALEKAESTGATIVVIASGGKLAEVAKAKNYPLALLPTGLQPRHATFFGLQAILQITDGFGITENKSSELAVKSEYLQNIVESWKPEVPTQSNIAKQIATELMGKSIVIYGGPLLSAATYKWKISFNENSKHIAWYNLFPEFNHNEFLGWTQQPVQKPYAVIELRSTFEHPRVSKRFDVSNKLLSGLMPAPIVVNAEGNDLLEHMLWIMVLGDYVSLYLALLSNLNPFPVELIEKLKKELVE